MEAVLIQRLEIGCSVTNVKKGITALVLELQMPQLAGMISSTSAPFANSLSYIFQVLAS